MAIVKEMEYRSLVKEYLVIIARYNPKMYYQEKLQAAKIFAVEDLRKKYPDIKFTI